MLLFHWDRRVSILYLLFIESSAPTMLLNFAYTTVHKMKVWDSDIELLQWHLLSLIHFFWWKKNPVQQGDTWVKGQFYFQDRLTAGSHMPLTPLAPLLSKVVVGLRRATSPKRASSLVHLETLHLTSQDEQATKLSPSIQRRRMDKSGDPAKTTRIALNLDQSCEG